MEKNSYYTFSKKPHTNKQLEKIFTIRRKLNMKRFAYLMAAALLLMTTLAGCSNNKTGSMDNGRGTTGTPTSYTSNGYTNTGMGTGNGNSGYTGATNGTSRSNGGNGNMGTYGNGVTGNYGNGYSNGVNNVTADM